MNVLCDGWHKTLVTKLPGSFSALLGPLLCVSYEMAVGPLELCLCFLTCHTVVCVKFQHNPWPVVKIFMPMSSYQWMVVVCWASRVRCVALIAQDSLDIL